MAHRLTVLRAAAALAVVMSSSAALAQHTWLGGTGSWSDPAMWSGGVPAAGSDAFIDGGNAANSTVVVTGDMNKADITVDAGDTIQFPVGDHRTTPNVPFNAPVTYTINGKLESTGAGTVTIDCGNYPNIAPYDWTIDGIGTLEFNATDTTLFGREARLTIGPGITTSGSFSTGGFNSFTNNGTITVAGAGKLVQIGQYLPEPGVSTNNGSIQVGPGATLRTYRFVNSAAGVISVNGGTYDMGADLLSNASTNLGTIELVNATLNASPFLTAFPPVVLGTVRSTNSTVRSPYHVLTVQAGSTFSGTANVEGTLSVAGTLAPGNPTGTIAVSASIDLPGNVSLLANSHFDVDLGPGGTTGLLTATGILNLTAADNFLDLSTLPGALFNTPYVIATAGAITGTFEHVTPGFNVQYTPTSVIVTAIPEPASLAGLTAVAAGLARRRRR